MKNFNDSHLEVKKWFDSDFETHPYEVGWADEAIFFIMVEKLEGSPTLEARVQLSQDGVSWCDEPEKSGICIRETGLHCLKAAPNFGNYIRLAVKISGGRMFLNVHIACKG